MKITIEIRPIRVKDAAEEYMAHRRRSPHNSRSSVERSRMVLRELAEAAGNTYLHDIRTSHLDDTFARWANCTPNRRNEMKSTLNKFFQWAVAQDYVKPNWNLLSSDWYGREKNVKPRHVPLDVSERPRMLDIAGQHHPEWRAYVSAGLGLMGRPQSEIAPIRLNQINLRLWQVTIARPKIGQPDAYDTLTLMPDERPELLAWLNWYQAWSMQYRGHELQAHDHLFPAMRFLAKGRPGDKNRVDDWRLYPNQENRRVGKLVRTVLEELGYPVKNDEGKYNNKGGAHSLRRFAARWWFDYLCSERGYDGAMRVVMSTLGHSEQSTTEHYLGLDVDLHTRNRLLGEYHYTAGAVNEWTTPELDEQAATFPEWGGLRLVG